MLEGTDGFIDGAAPGEKLTKVIPTLSIPGLGTFGLASTDVPAMVALACKSNSMRYNPARLPEAVLTEVLAKAL